MPGYFYAVILWGRWRRSKRFSFMGLRIHHHHKKRGARGRWRPYNKPIWIIYPRRSVIFAVHPAALLPRNRVFCVVFSSKSVLFFTGFGFVEISTREKL
jgi:hypothetical protein